MRRPSFVFDTPALPAGATLTRASEARCFDAAGVLQSRAVDAARFDHHPTTHALRGILIEPAATNTLSYSEAFDIASWAKNHATVSADAATAPDGALTADKLVEGAGAGVPYLAFNVGMAAGAKVCPIFAKAAPRRYLWISLDGTATFVMFDLTLGTVATVGGTHSGQIEDVGSGWYRCTASMTSADTSPVYFGASDNAASYSYTGDGSSGIYIWGIQQEASLTPTSYISTTVASASRAADALVLDWAGKGVPNGAITARYTFDDGSAQNVATTVASGTSTVPTTLNRPRIRRIERVG